MNVNKSAVLKSGVCGTGVWLEMRTPYTQDWKQETHYSAKGSRELYWWNIELSSYTLIRVEEMKNPEKDADFLRKTEGIFPWSFPLQAWLFLRTSRISFEWAGEGNKVSWKYFCFCKEKEKETKIYLKFICPIYSITLPYLDQITIVIEF